jgi:hypothetical protein
MDTKTLTTLVDIDLLASKSCRIIQLYTVSLFEFIAAFETALTLLAEENPACLTPLYWNGLSQHTQSSSNCSTNLQTVTKELAVWFEYGNNYTVYDTSETLHRCTLSVYQICTARIDQTTLDNTRLYSESEALFKAMKCRPTLIRQPIYTYDYHAIKKYLPHASNPISHVIYSKQPCSIKTTLRMEKRYITVFDLLFSRITLSSVAQQYYTQGCLATHD